MTKTERKAELLKIIDNATTEDATEWANESEQWMYCTDMLGITCTEDGDRFCDYWVARLEEQYESLLLKKENQ